MASEIAQGPQRYRRLVNPFEPTVKVEPKNSGETNRVDSEKLYFWKRGGKKRSLNSHDKDGCNLIIHLQSSTYIQMYLFLGGVVATRISVKPSLFEDHKKKDFKFLNSPGEL